MGSNMSYARAFCHIPTWVNLFPVKDVSSGNNNFREAWFSDWGSGLQMHNNFSTLTEYSLTEIISWKVMLNHGQYLRLDEKCIYDHS